MEGTWPAKRAFREGPWMLREGDGGGKRVSAATAEGPVGPEDIAMAEQAMEAIGQPPLFMLRAGDEALDAALAERGYEIIDPVTIYSIAPAGLTDIPIPRVTVFDLWEPLAIMREIWAQGGVGPARLRVMERAKGPKTALLSRLDDKPAGVAFAAMHDGTAMVHAVEVLPHQRRKGAAAWMMRGAAFWAQRQGAHTLSVICVDANAGANALYRSLGFSVQGHYHYRHKPKEAS
ncbi:GNAT family N-acetyltransferase [Aestuariivita boseongensis]|uniref:GNAT family N-acetyltransferase n=1 Tax=Aestuariivita boseongensis TaxID=1470562 RepID=UPI000682768E|nr:GNAT family N-acetyltransferase [Aestuariivita boseongensis]